jgi:hypothetical protein
MGFLDIDGTLLSADATPLAVIVIKANDFAVLNENSRVGTHYPADETLSALV